MRGLLPQAATFPRRAPRGRVRKTPAPPPPSHRTGGAPRGRIRGGKKRGGSPRVRGRGGDPLRGWEEGRAQGGRGEETPVRGGGGEMLSGGTQAPAGRSGEHSWVWVWRKVVGNPEGLGVGEINPCRRWVKGVRRLKCLGEERGTPPDCGWELAELGGAAEAEGSPPDVGSSRGKKEQGQVSVQKLRLLVSDQLLPGRLIPVDSCGLGTLCPHRDPGHPEGLCDL